MKASEIKKIVENRFQELGASKFFSLHQIIAGNSKVNFTR